MVDEGETERSDAAVSPGQAQNTGPEHQTPPGAQERQTKRSPGAEAAELRQDAIPDGGEPAVRDDL